MAKKDNLEDATQESKDCFLIMPISDSDGYESGHFKRVYLDIFHPAIVKAGLNPIRADDVKQTNFIHLDILEKLIHSPIAVCDLSTRNPNVLFELGLRQAFDKPTILVQELGTPKIFDISPLRFTEYRKELKYREVIEDQNAIYEAIIQTMHASKKGEGINSLISLLSLSNPARLKEPSEKDESRLLQILMGEISDLKSDFRRYSNLNTNKINRSSVKVASAINSSADIDVLISGWLKMIKSEMPKDEIINSYFSIKNTLIRCMDIESNLELRGEIKMALDFLDRRYDKFSLDL